MPEGKSDQQSVGHSLLGDASAPVLLLQEEYEEPYYQANHLNDRH